MSNSNPPPRTGRENQNLIWIIAAAAVILALLAYFLFLRPAPEPAVAPGIAPGETIDVVEPADGETIDVVEPANGETVDVVEPAADDDVVEIVEPAADDADATLAPDATP
jgi:LPXTG-motif cell wall-anchored protein